MPTYDYECEKCNHTFEEFQSFSDPKLTICPACGEEALKRLFGTGAAVLFKGSGFYETDYRSEAYKSAAKKESEGSKSSDSSSSKSESGSAGESGSKTDTGTSGSSPSSAKE